MADTRALPLLQGQNSPERQVQNYTALVLTTASLARLYIEITSIQTPPDFLTFGIKEAKDKIQIMIFKQHKPGTAIICRDHAIKCSAYLNSFLLINISRIALYT